MSSKSIVVCGAGEIGLEAVRTLGGTRAGYDGRDASITVVDRDPDRLQRLEDELDVATVLGDASHAEVLVRAGVAEADLVLAATDHDEVNLLCGTLAKRLGARKVVVRVHHDTYFHHRGLDYSSALSVDRLICPEHATALAIARALRNPGALAIELFGRGRIEMQEFEAAGGSDLGRPLSEIAFPEGTRLAMIRRRGEQEAELPRYDTRVETGDTVVLVGNADVFVEARRTLRREHLPKRRVVLMGGPPMAVWLCQALKDRRFAIRLFETNRARAEALAEELDWVTIINADPTDEAVFREESLAQSDVFVSLLGSDEENIVAALLAHLRGIERVFTVVKQEKYVAAAVEVDITQTFNTQAVAGDEIIRLIEDEDIQYLGSLAAGRVEVRQVRIRANSPVLGRRVRDLRLTPDWMIAALSRHDTAFVPQADDQIMQNDVLLVCGRVGLDAETHLHEVFDPEPRA